MGINMIIEYERAFNCSDHYFLNNFLNINNSCLRNLQNLRASMMNPNITPKKKEVENNILERNLSQELKFHKICKIQSYNCEDSKKKISYNLLSQKKKIAEKDTENPVDEKPRPNKNTQRQDLSI